MDTATLQSDSDIECLLNVASGDSSYSINASGPQKASRLPQLTAAASASLAGVAGGFILGYASPIIPELLRDNIITKDEASWFGAMPTLGAIIGGPLSGIMIEWFGRKMTVMLCCPLAVIGWLLIAVTLNVPVMLLGRGLTGVALGMSSLCIPVYVAEVASKDMRGGLGALYQTSLNSGIVLAYCLGIPLQKQWLAVASACVPTLCIILMVFMPESPRWLLKRKEELKARSALTWLRGPHYDIEDEHLEIVASLSTHEEGVHIQDFKRASLYKPFMISLFLMAMQQLTGINAAGTYAQYILQHAGFNTSAKQVTVFLGIIGVAATFVSCLIQDRFGRRTLLSISGVMCAVSLTALGTYFYLVKDLNVAQRDASPLRWLSCTALLLYAAFFSIAWGPTIWLVVAELLPSRAKGFTASVATVVNWSMAFLVAKEFLDLEHYAGDFGAFWTYGSFTALGVIFIITVLPETMGRTLEEIERHFASHS